MNDLFKTLTGSKWFQSLVFSWLVPVAIWSIPITLVLYPVAHRIPWVASVVSHADSLGIHPAVSIPILLVLISVVLSLSSRTLYQTLEGLNYWPTFLFKRRVAVHSLQWCVLAYDRDQENLGSQLKQSELDRDRLVTRREAGEVSLTEPIREVTELITALKAEMELHSQTRESARNRRRSKSHFGREMPLFVLPLLEQYPHKEDLILPTRFGNLMRSFESYGSAMYGLDSQTFWYELTTYASKESLDSLSDARIGSDFYVALLYLDLLLAALAFALVFWSGSISCLVCGLVAGLLAPFVHGRLRKSTEEWRFAIQAVVNLGRVKLAEQMGLVLPNTLAEERRMWTSLTGFVQYRSQAYASRLDKYRQKRHL